MCAGSVVFKSFGSKLAANADIVHVEAGVGVVHTSIGLVVKGIFYGPVVTERELNTKL